MRYKKNAAGEIEIENVMGTDVATETRTTMMMLTMSESRLSVNVNWNGRD